LSTNGITYPTPIYPNTVNGQQNRQQNGQRVGQQYQQPLYKDQNGNLTTKTQAMLSFEGRINEQNKAIQSHEEAHMRAAGPQANGSPVYNTTSIFGHTLITGGHQGVNVPSEIGFMAAKPQIENTMKAAQYTINGAEAPSTLGGMAGELSDADRAVAARGRAVLSSSKLAFRQRETIDSRLQRLEGTVPDGALKPEQVAKAEGKGASNPQKKAVGERLNIMA